MVENKKIGTFIQTLRKERGLTQKELAEMIHVSDKTISKWENAGSIPDTEMLKPLCDALMVSLNELISGEKLPPENYSQKAEENLMDLLKKEQESKRRLRLSIFIGILLIIATFIFSIITCGGQIALYLDTPSLLFIAVPAFGLVLISGKRDLASIISLLRKTIIPIGASVSIVSLVVILAIVAHQHPDVLGPNLAVCVLAFLYSLIIYLVLTVWEARRS